MNQDTVDRQAHDLAGPEAASVRGKGTEMRAESSGIDADRVINIMDAVLVATTMSCQESSLRTKKVRATKAQTLI